MRNASTGCIQTASISKRILSIAARPVYAARSAKSSSGISISWLPPGEPSLGETVLSKTKPVLAKAIETTPTALIVILDGGTFSIPWEKCSQRLAEASMVERTQAQLSPSGYGIHWPLIDEDLAVGPLLSA